MSKSFAAVCMAIALHVVAAQKPTERITWQDLAPFHDRLRAAGITADTLTSYVDRERESNARRVREGDLDHLVFYVLQSTRFTSLPPIEPALSAKALVESPDPSQAPAPVVARIAAFVRAVDSNDRDPRLAYFRALVAKEFPDRRQRERALAGEYVRAMKFVYQKEFVAQRSEQPRDAVAELYRTRGLSTDTAVEAGFLIYQGLGVVHSLRPEQRIRRVLIVGPGLDLAPRTAFLEASPPESYQPWAVLDALLSLGLSREDDVEVVAADINPRVVQHLARATASPPTLTLVSEMRDSETIALTQEFRDYFSTLGKAIGDVSAGAAAASAPGHLSKTVRVKQNVARALRAAPLDVVTERLSGEPFDLIVATNILPYFNDVELTLAMTNVARMLAPDGILLHNEARPVLHDVTNALALPLEQSRHAVIASVRGSAAPLVDSVWLHRKSRRSNDDLGFSFTNIAQRAGLSARTVYGAQGTNTYLIDHRCTRTPAMALVNNLQNTPDLFRLVRLHGHLVQLAVR